MYFFFKKYLLPIGPKTSHARVGGQLESRGGHNGARRSGPGRDHVHGAELLARERIWRHPVESHVAMAVAALQECKYLRL